MTPRGSPGARGGSHYETLGVSPAAPTEVVRAAYLALAKLYHPDGRRPDEERMKAINEAWDVLGNEVSRAVYDADLVHTGGAPAATRGAEDGGTGRAGPRLGEDGWGEDGDEPAARPAGGRRNRRVKRQGRRGAGGGTSAADGDGPDDRWDDRDAGDGADDDGDDRWVDPWDEEDGGEDWDEDEDWDDEWDADWDADDVWDDRDPDRRPARRAWPWSRRPRDPTAVVGRRVAAFLVDVAVVYVLALVALRLVGLARADRIPAPEGGRPEDVCQFVGAPECVTIGDAAYILGDTDGWSVRALCVVVPAVLLFAGLQGVTALTPGKALLGIRTVRADGLPPGVARALVRLVCVAIDAFPYVLPLLGVSLMRSNLGHRRAGDVMAGTFVVRRRAAGHPVAVPGMVTVRQRARRW